MIKTGVVVGAAALMLSACGSSETPKEEYLNAYKGIQDAKTLDVTHKVKVESDDIDAFEVVLDVKSDYEKEQHEIDVQAKLKAEGMSLDVELPIYVDGVEGKTYTKSEGLVSVMGGFMSLMGMPFSLDVPEEFQGKIIAFNGEDFGAYTGEISNEEVEFSKEYYTFLNSFDDKEFKDSNGVTTLTVDGEKFKTVLEGIVESSGISTDELGVSSDDLLNDNTEFKDVKITSEVKKGVLVSETFHITMSAEVNGEKTEALLEVSNVYNEIDGKVSFTFDIKDENMVTIEEMMGDVLGGAGQY